MQKLIVAALASTLSFSQAAVVIDNITPTGTQNFSSGATGPVGGLFSPANHQTAFSFTTGPSGGTLTSVQVLGLVADTSGPLEATISTGPSVPGGTNPTLIDSITPATTGGQILSFTPSSGLPLVGNTLYWIHFTVPSDSGNYTMQNSNGAVIENNGWSLNSTWSMPSPSPWNEITSAPFARTRLEIANVPEPTSALLSGLGILTLLRRRR